MLPKLKHWICWIILFISQAAFAQTELNPAPSPTPKFMSFSDIHFNPFSTCKTLTFKSCPIVEKLQQAPATEWEKIFESAESKELAGYSHDTNYALLKNSLAEIKLIAAKEHPDFVIVLGDFLAHHFHTQYILYTHDRSKSGYQSFVKKTFEFLTQTIHQTLPNATIYMVVGNNDSYNGDYNVQPGGIFLHDLANTWTPLISDSENQHNLRATFPIGGFYAVNLSAEKQKLIVLNTVLFSAAANGHDAKQAAQIQLKWLRQQLQSAKAQHQPVLLAFHIPDGVNVYLTILNIFHGIDEFWQPQDSKEFNAILKEYGDTIKAILPGHIHMDSFQVINLDASHAIPVSYTSSISPIFGNNPGFKVYSYDKNSLVLTDYDMYFLALNDKTTPQPEWRKEYSFKDAYHEDCKMCNIVTAMKSLTPSGDYATHYQEFYAVGTQNQPIIKKHYWVPYYWCNVFDSQIDAYETCIKH